MAGEYAPGLGNPAPLASPTARLATMLPRYLTAFRPKDVPHHFTDVLILGGGLAGLRAALEVDAQLTTLVISKLPLETSNSQWAQGGIAGVLDPDDHFDHHVEDTLTAGGTLCDREVVESVVRQAPEEIQKLIGWGTHFDEEAGRLALGREGGHSHHRIVHALGDRTGREVMRALIAKTAELENLRSWDRTFTLDLLTDDDGCRGAVVWHPKRGVSLVWAKQTILCTGGAGQLYRETTNPAVATADGHAMAYRAGAELRDMEFVQFHPTVLYLAGSSRHLITEAIRGEGAWLIDSQGHRFMPDYDPRAELAPRDIVSRAITMQMERTAHPNVYLDLRHLEGQLVRRRFPGIVTLCEKFGLDVQRDTIPVRPGAHYMIGGVSVDAQGRTTLPGLWAAGEVSSTGLHGANRLASNSLLEGLVYGARCGRGASEIASGRPDDLRGLPITSPTRTPPTRAELDLADVRASLRSLMGRRVGIRRSGDGLAEAAAQNERWCGYILEHQFEEPEGWELQNMLVTARVIIQAAQLRNESRGVHYRSDFPSTRDPEWQRHLCFRGPSAPGSAA